MPAKKSTAAAGGAKLPNYEDALRELNEIVERIESGSLSLDETIRCYERGMELSLRCHELLEQAQQRVEHVEHRHGIAREPPADADTDDDSPASAGDP